MLHAPLTLTLQFQSYSGLTNALVLELLLGSRTSALLSYEIFQNLFARAGSWIIKNVGGLPMGGPLSARLACQYLTSCELKTIRTNLLSFKILANRYRDNLYLFLGGGTMSARV